MTMKTITGPELRDAARAQRVPLEHRAFKCPMCATVQSAFDFIQAGAGVNFDEVSKHLGTSCVGRFTGASTPRATPDGKACDWTLHGQLRMHKLEVLDDDGQAYPIFEPASPEEAQAHAAKNDPSVTSGSYNFDSFIREATALNLTAKDLAAALAVRPEFADCVPPAAGATT